MEKQKSKISGLRVSEELRNELMDMKYKKRFPSMDALLWALLKANKERISKLKEEEN